MGASSFRAGRYAEHVYVGLGRPQEHGVRTRLDIVLALVTLAMALGVALRARADVPPFRWSAEGRLVQLDVFPDSPEDVRFGMIAPPIRFGWMVLPEPWLALGLSTGVLAEQRGDAFAVGWEVLPRLELLARIDPVAVPFAALNVGPSGLHPTDAPARYRFETSASLGAHFFLRPDFSFSSALEVGWLHEIDPSRSGLRLGISMNLAGWVG
jgi:hypothetical protein